MARASSRLQLAVLGDLDGVVGGRVLQGVHQGEPVAALAADVQQLFEGDDVRQGQLAENRVQFLQRDLHLRGDLGLGGGAPELGFEGGVRALDVAGLLADGARDPVEGAEFVDHGAADAGDGVRLELDRALDVELLDGVDEAEDA